MATPTRDERTPLDLYTDDEIVAEVFRRDLKVSDFAEALFTDDEAVLETIRGAMERPYDRP